MQQQSVAPAPGGDELSTGGQMVLPSPCADNSTMVTVFDVPPVDAVPTRRHKLKGQLTLWGVYSGLSFVWLAVEIWHLHDDEVYSSASTCGGSGSSKDPSSIVEAQGIFESKDTAALIRRIGAALHFLPLLVLMTLLSVSAAVKSGRHASQRRCLVTLVVTALSIIAGQTLNILGRGPARRFPPLIVLTVLASVYTTGSLLPLLIRAIISALVFIAFIVYGGVVIVSGEISAPLGDSTSVTDHVLRLTLMLWEVILPLVLLLPLMYRAFVEAPAFKKKVKQAQDSHQAQGLPPSRIDCQTSGATVQSFLVKRIADMMCGKENDLEKVEKFVVHELWIKKKKQQQRADGDQRAKDIPSSRRSSLSTTSNASLPGSSSENPMAGAPTQARGTWEETAVDEEAAATRVLESFLAIIRIHRQSLAGASRKVKRKKDGGASSRERSAAEELESVGTPNNWVDTMECIEDDCNTQHSSPSGSHQLVSPGFNDAGSLVEAGAGDEVRDFYTPTSSVLSSITSSRSCSTINTVKPTTLFKAAASVAPSAEVLNQPIERRMALILIRLQLKPGVTDSMHTFTNCLAQVHSTVITHVEKSQGYLVPLQGDGFLISFNTAHSTSLPALRGAQFLCRLQQCFKEAGLWANSVTFNAALCSGRGITATLQPSSHTTAAHQCQTFIHATWRPHLDTLIQHMSVLGLRGTVLMDAESREQCKAQVELRLVDKLVAATDPISPLSSSLNLTAAGVKGALTPDGSMSNLLHTNSAFLNPVPSPDYISILSSASCPTSVALQFPSVCPKPSSNVIELCGLTENTSIKGLLMDAEADTAEEVHEPILVYELVGPLPLDHISEHRYEEWMYLVAEDEGKQQQQQEHKEEDSPQEEDITGGDHGRDPAPPSKRTSVTSASSIGGGGEATVSGPVLSRMMSEAAALALTEGNFAIALERLLWIEQHQTLTLGIGGTPCGNPFLVKRLTRYCLARVGPTVPLDLEADGAGLVM